MTAIRPELSRDNKYWISRHKYYELKHYCLQYPMWKKELYKVHFLGSSSSFERGPSGNLPSDPTGDLAVMNLYYMDKVGLIERIAEETDKYLASYILKAVTEGLSYSYLKSRLDIPCSRDTYYNRYRRFFWLLSQERD